MKILGIQCKCKKYVSKCTIDEFNNKYTAEKRKKGYKIRFIEESLIKLEECICKNEETTNNQIFLF